VHVHARVVPARARGGRGAGERESAAARGASWAERATGDEPPPPPPLRNDFNAQDEVDQPKVVQRARQRGSERREVLLVARAVGERDVDVGRRRLSRGEVARGVDVKDVRAGAAREQRGGAVALVDLRAGWARAR
jgi:hypothetical protein